MARDDLPQVARCHRVAYRRDHFTAVLTHHLLEDFYRELLATNRYSYVALGPTGEIQGFLVAGDAWTPAMMRYVRRHPVRLVLTLLRHPAFVPGKVGDAIRLLGRRLSRARGGPRPGKVSILSIATVPDRRNTGVGAALVRRLEEELRRDGIGRYRLTVSKGNPSAIAFYERNGFIRESEGHDSVRYVRYL